MTRSLVSQDENDLYSYFNNSVSAVQAHADQFEEEYARPALRTSQAFFDERPIAATFIAIFALLSFFPILSFIGFSIFAVASITIIALTCAFLASMTVVLIFLSILVLVLLATLCSSIFLTFSAVSVYTFIRLIMLVRMRGHAGALEWAAETKGYVFEALHNTSSRPKDADAHDSETLDELGIEIKHEDSVEHLSEPTYENSYSEEEPKVVD